jgi:hypothetical protein
MAYHKSVQGVGWVSLVPSGTYPDPVHLAEIEALDFNINEEDSDLEDSNGDIIDSFTSKRSFEGTVTLKDLSGSLIAAATRGVTVAAGTKQGYAQTGVIPTTPFQITVTEGATFADDLGVIDLTSGKAMIAAATSTGTNVYAVSAAGVYTFNTADAGHTVLINSRSTKSAIGNTASIASVTASTTTYYGLHCYQVIASKPWGIYIPQARLPGLSAKFGKGGWSDTTLKFKASKDSSGNFVHVYLPE